MVTLCYFFNYRAQKYCKEETTGIIVSREMSRLEVALDTLPCWAPPPASAGHAGLSTKSESLAAHTRSVTTSHRQLEPAQENQEKTRISSRRNYRIKSLQAGRWSETGVGACRGHLIIMCALLHCGHCAKTDEWVSVPRNANLCRNNTSRYSCFV